LARRRRARACVASAGPMGRRARPTGGRVFRYGLVPQLDPRRSGFAPRMRHTRQGGRRVRTSSSSTTVGLDTAARADSRPTYSMFARMPTIASHPSRPRGRGPGSRHSAHCFRPEPGPRALVGPEIEPCDARRKTARSLRGAHRRRRPRREVTLAGHRLRLKHAANLGEITLARALPQHREDGRGRRDLLVLVPMVPKASMTREHVRRSRVAHDRPVDGRHGSAKSAGARSQRHLVRKRGSWHWQRRQRQLRVAESRVASPRGSPPIPLSAEHLVPLVAEVVKCSSLRRFDFFPGSTTGTRESAPLPTTSARPWRSERR